MDMHVFQICGENTQVCIQKCTMVLPKEKIFTDVWIPSQKEGKRKLMNQIKII